MGSTASSSNTVAAKRCIKTQLRQKVDHIVCRIFLISSASSVGLNWWIRICNLVAISGTVSCGGFMGLYFFLSTVYTSLPTLVLSLAGSLPSNDR